MSQGWAEVAADFHERVRSNCWDTLAGQLIKLHEPHLVDGQPVCRGCDRERSDRGGSDPVWPCRTYTVIASTMLNVQDVEVMLDRMLETAVTLGAGTTLSGQPRPSRLRTTALQRGERQR